MRLYFIGALCGLLCLLFSFENAQCQSGAFKAVSLNGLVDFDQASSNWQVVERVDANRAVRRDISVKEGTGVLVNMQTEEARGHLFTSWSHADLELDLEVLMPKESNSGLYFQGRYEIQLFDSWGVQKPKHSDMGGVYQRWDESRAEEEKGYEGHAPLVNVARAPGLWQHLNVLFRAPRFNDLGEKVENARFLRVTLNGVVIHENVELSGPTRAAAFKDEVAEAPLMIQGDHGPVAFRNINYRTFDPATVEVSDIMFRHFEGQFNNQMPDLSSLQIAQEERVSSITSQRVESLNGFVLQHEGTLLLPTTGEYLFEVAHTSRVRLEINGEEVLTDRSEDVSTLLEFPRNAATVNLSKGEHSFRLTYAKGLWHKAMTVLGLYVTGPDMARVELTEAGSVPYNAYLPYRIAPESVPSTQRNFVQHKGRKRTHAISVGNPEGIHYNYDLSRGALLHIWKGPYLDTSTMWYQRGHVQSGIPIGSVIERSGLPNIAVLASPEATWPDSLTNYTFNNYRLNEQGEPSFIYALGASTITDNFTVGEDQRSLQRTIQVAQPEMGTWVLLADSEMIVPVDDTTYAVDNQLLYIVVDSGKQPTVRNSGNRYQLLMPVLPGDDVAEIKYSLVW